MVRRRKGAHGEGGHGNAERWLLSYADMITLLMAFFIMLYSMSILNLNKFREVAISIRSGFGGMVEGQGKSVLGSSGQFSIRPSPVPGDTAGVPPEAVAKLTKFVQKMKLEKSVKLRMDERGLVITLVTDKIVFERGRSYLSPEAALIIDGLAESLKDIPNFLRVEGHTCDLRVSSSKYPSNWELSTTRATTVVRHLIEKNGIPAHRLSAAGYADSKPLVPNNSEKNRSLNRRVDIVVLKTGTVLPER